MEPQSVTQRPAPACQLERKYPLTPFPKFQPQCSDTPKQPLLYLAQLPP